MASLSVEILNPTFFCLLIVEAPTLEVIIIIVFLKFTVFPWPSVSLPSSKIWSNTLNTSGWAFSISSNKTTE